MNSQEKNILKQEKEQIKDCLAKIKTENKAISRRMSSAITLIGSIRTSQLGVEAIIEDLESKLNKK